ncbi:MAG: ABC transporter permease [Alphaproteobacteria bacterium]|nr:ABC transporter permease [Alphaproteobacteria bacterium]
MLRQIFIVSALNFKSLKGRFWQSMVIVVGLGATIGVLLSMMSMTVGLRAAYDRVGDPGRAIVVSKGAESEGSSSVTRAMAPIIMDAPGVAKDVDGKPLADRQLNIGVPVLRLNGTKGYTTMRGFGPKGVALRPEFHMLKGRMFQAGKRELVVGVGAQTMFQNVKIGDQVILPDGGWPIVGVYQTGDILDGQLVGDTETMLTAFHRSAYNSILVRLASHDTLDAFRRALTTNPALSVTVERHSDWYKKISGQATTLLAVLAYVVGFVMAIGALFGCLNTMYAAISTRGREIATLRALGYGAFPVAMSVVLEAVALAVAGALAGAAIAWLMNDGRQGIWGVNIFHLSVPPSMIGLGVGWAIVVALLGGLLPSIRAARRPVVEALRAT